MAEDKVLEATKLAEEILQLSRDTIVVHMRFMDTAVARLKPEARPGTGTIATDGSHIFYDPFLLLLEYQKEPQSVVRYYLHMLLHCIFHHSFGSDKTDTEYWELAADMAVENIILELGIREATISTDEEAMDLLKQFKSQVPAMTAEHLYRNFFINEPSNAMKQKLRELFYKDEHVYWRGQEEMVVSEADWKKISERIKADLKSFSKGKSHSESMKKNLNEATRDHYNYAEILQKFTVMGEDLKLNEDEFDYIFYTYGLEHYGNMPLIEPLEYRDVNKVKEFVIVIDTSASCRGSIVQAFLNKTYSILKGTENFFAKINVHIIQCDSEVKSDTKITCDEDFEYFMEHGTIEGFGSTDFRPAFAHVQELKETGEFENLKGMIYFTDGYGIYPTRMPDYDVIFAFLEEDDSRPEVPDWAIKVIVEGLEELH